MRYCALSMLVGLLGVLYGCGSTGSVIDSLSNNTSGDMVRGVKLQAGVDMSAGNPVPSVNFSMGSLARKGKADRMVMVIDNNTTDIVSENYKVCVTNENVRTSTNNPRQLIKTETRTYDNAQFTEGIFVNQTSSFGMGVTAGNLMSAGGGTMIAIGTVGTNTPRAVLNARLKPQSVGTSTANYAP